MSLDLATVPIDARIKGILLSPSNQAPNTQSPSSRLAVAPLTPPVLYGTVTGNAECAHGKSSVGTAAQSEL